jgi:hypothetical protein
VQINKITSGGVLHIAVQLLYIVLIRGDHVQTDFLLCLIAESFFAYPDALATVIRESG